MGKQNRLREAQRHAAEQAIAVRLRAHTPARTQPAFINSFAEFAPAYRNRIELYRDLALRPPEAWRCGLRIRSPQQRFLELVRFTFADYPVPHHLENAWIDDAPDAWQGDAIVAPERPDFRRWFIAVGRGESLHRDAARALMTKRETHHFVAAPAAIETPVRAFWYAFARAHTDDMAAALRVARTKLARYSVVDPFWKEAARFFAHNPVPVHEMNDLIDYIDAAHRGDEDFTLKGRSLATLQRRMAEWHRLRRMEVSGLRWLGHPRPNAEYETSVDGQGVIWRFRQIRSSGGLVQEGHEMEHCVATYQEQCVRGSISIWSLTRENPLGTIKRCLTIELDRSGCIVQCRGFANRPPVAEEIEVLRRWVEDQDLWDLSGL